MIFFTVYIVVIVSIVFCSTPLNNRVLCWLFTLTLISIAGFRSSDIGADYNQYVAFINSIDSWFSVLVEPTFSAVKYFIVDDEQNKWHTALFQGAELILKLPCSNLSLPHTCKNVHLTEKLKKLCHILRTLSIM